MTVLKKSTEEALLAIVIVVVFWTLVWAATAAFGRWKLYGQVFKPDDAVVTAVGNGFDVESDSGGLCRVLPGARLVILAKKGRQVAVKVIQPSEVQPSINFCRDGMIAVMDEEYIRNNL